MRTAQAREPITVLGATGSVGLSTLDVIGRNSDRFCVAALTANRNAGELARLAITHGARYAAVADPSAYAELRSLLAGTGIEAGGGPEAVIEAALRPTGRVMAAIVGAAGLAPTLAAAGQGATVLLANKECLVSAGRLFMETAKAGGARILPVDSEHCAIFQALGEAKLDTVDAVTITASGGPFRTWTADRMARARPEEAVRHPNWSMGAKISVDSATLMNKGLELIEASYLFGLDAARLHVLVHPESIVHGFVSYIDGSVIAQLAPPDMRTPIAHALAWPDRIESPTAKLDLPALGRLTFEEPDLDRFPALDLARRALEATDGTATALNAANEFAVNAFLSGSVAFPDIAKIVEKVLAKVGGLGAGEPATLDDAMSLDGWARDIARSLVPGRLERAV